MSEQDHRTRPPEDKSLFYYGSLYHRLMDPLIKPAREAIVAWVPESATVLDIGCGTGLLSFALKAKKNCQVTGIDLSLRMLDFAKANNPYEDVKFIHQDATDMSAFKDRSFDYVVILNVIHELTPIQQQKMIQESFRVGDKIILFDSNVPLPWNGVGIIKRAIEITFGLDHYPQFRNYLSSGGIPGILQEAGYGSNIRKQVTHSGECNLLALVAKSQP